MDDDGVLATLSLRELRARCEAEGILCDGAERSELVKQLALKTAAAEDVEGSREHTDMAAAVPPEDEGSSDDEEALLQQALLMSQESEASLASLPVRTLRERCKARGISMDMVTEKADLVAALLGDDSQDDGTEASNIPRASGVNLSGAPSLADAVPDVQVLARFEMRFACIPAVEVGLGDHLEQGGKVYLPRSSLAALTFLGGNLPTTMLLRMTYQDSSCFVSIADFIDDDAALRAASSSNNWSAGTVPRWGPGGVGVAAVFVPRWVRSQLAAVEATVAISLVSLPKAAAIVLQPHTDSFAQRLGTCSDPRGVLTELMNRYVAIGVGDVIHLHVGAGDSATPPLERTGERFALDVVALRGLPGTRCGLPEGAAQMLDVGAALRGLTEGPMGVGPPQGVAVRAACLVDADVICEFAPSLETADREGREEEQAAAVRAAAEEATAREAAAARAAAEAAAAACASAAAAREARRDAACTALSALQASEARVPSSSGRVTTAVQCPDGARLVATFTQDTTLLACFQLVEAEWHEKEGTPLLPAEFSLATRFPRRCMARASASQLTLGEAGLVSTQELLFVEVEQKTEAGPQDQ